jgi:gliding motility-associated-like protein
LIKVPVKPEVLIYAPNAFTPDGDEFNQSWSVIMEGIDITVFDLLVYNRWGEVIWASKDVNATWDGTYKGKIVPAGIYNWTIRTKDALNDKKYEFTGSITVLR